MLINKTIYNQIWQADSNRFSVSLRNEQGDWFNPDADILLDHQCKSANQRGVDLAPDPLFCKINEARLFEPTYAALIALFDNYVAECRLPENYTKQEKEEIELFLNLILETQPLKIAYDYISQNLEYPMSLKKFKEELRTIWFALFTHYWADEIIPFCSGFEHIFVGEAKFISENKDGSLLGYHNWIKFYLDESTGKIDFHGTHFRIPHRLKILSSNIIVLQMSYTFFDEEEKQPVAQLYKEKGSFFVGSSPECEIAIATVAYYESLRKKKFTYQRSVIINRGRYDLIVQLEKTKDKQLGEHLRSFYPEFHGKIFRILPSVAAKLPKQSGPIVISSALIDPKANPTKEWVELKNISSSPISLDEWYLSDKFSRFCSLSGILEPDEQKQFSIRNGHLHSMQLTNSDGKIILYRADGQLVSLVTYKKVRPANIIIFWQDSQS